MRLTLSKWELGSPLGLLKVQHSIAKVKTPRIGAFFISLEIYWSVDVQNGLAWPIWTSETQVMAKRKVGSQTGNLTPDHGKSRIDPIPLRASVVWHEVGKPRQGLQLWFRPRPNQRSAPKVIVLQSCGTPSLGDFGTPVWESRDKKPFGCHSRGVIQSILYGGRRWLPPSSSHGESFESRIARGLS
jgi:hypothetical protein